MVDCAHRCLPAAVGRFAHFRQGIGVGTVHLQPVLEGNKESSERHETRNESLSGRS